MQTLVTFRKKLYCVVLELKVTLVIKDFLLLIGLY